MTLASIVIVEKSLDRNEWENKEKKKESSSGHCHQKGGLEFSFLDQPAFSQSNRGVINVWNATSAL